MRRILIISHLYEPSVNAVIKQLESDGTPWVRLNTEMFPLLASGEVLFSDQRSNASIKIADGTNIYFEEIGAVWNRRTGKWILPRHLKDYDLEFAENECRAFVYGMFRLLGGRSWVNDHDAERAASSKVYQLKIAQQCGFKVPETLITNSGARVREFVAQRSSKKVIFKPLSGVSAVGADFSRELVNTSFGKSLGDSIPVRDDTAKAQVVFTRVLSEPELERIDAIEFSPAIFQEYVDKRVELRVTVVGQDIFCAEIHSQELPSTRVDFRRMSFAEGEVPKHQVHKLPPNVSQQILDLMERLGLVFGCLDLIQSPDGEYVFLEVNPNGQWLWVQSMTGLPITQALASQLSRNKRF